MNRMNRSISGKVIAGTIAGEISKNLHASAVDFHVPLESDLPSSLHPATCRGRRCGSVPELARKYAAAIVGDAWHSSAPYRDHGMKLAKERYGSTSMLAA